MSKDKPGKHGTVEAADPQRAAIVADLKAMQAHGRAEAERYRAEARAVGAEIAAASGSDIGAIHQRAVLGHRQVDLVRNGELSQLAAADIGRELHDLGAR